MLSRRKLFSSFAALPFVGSLLGKETKQIEGFAFGGYVPRDTKINLDPPCYLYNVFPSVKVEPGTYLLQANLLLTVSVQKEIEDYLNSKAPEGVKFILLPYGVVPSFSSYWFNFTQPVTGTLTTSNPTENWVFSNLTVPASSSL